MQKPELLAPVGNVESFYAAIKAGADAIYLGLKYFNARERASNFSNYQLLQVLDEAHRIPIKVYITLNTVVKNHELSELLDILWFLSKAKVDAIIVQDWGTFYLAKQFFPKLTLHASTQMVNHNSLGTRYSKEVGFSRVILARELTFTELEEIKKGSPIETEIFVHGALCYSFSGMCLFSSYLGGAGANRGLCAQPCRRFYHTQKTDTLVFNMKDNQQILLVPKLLEMGITSLKIEGRLKSAEYVYKVVKAYRMALDDLEKIPDAVKLLSSDFGREKTQWFFDKHLVSPLTTFSGTGKPIGKVQTVQKKYITIETTEPLNDGNRIRIRTQNDSEPVALSINHPLQTESLIYQIKSEYTGINPGDEVTLIGSGEFHFSSKLKSEPPRIEQTIPHPFKAEILSKLKSIKGISKETLYLRINDLGWLPHISFDYINQLILQLSRNELLKIEEITSKLNNHAQKVWIELPQFIPEKDITFYKLNLKRFFEKGFHRFSLSHLSQKELLPQGSNFGTNENVYCYNDAAALFIESEKADWMTSPFENEMENLFQGSNKNILVPIFYYPRLFYSRQPIAKDAHSIHDSGNYYRVFIRNGITEVIPKIPVSLMQYKSKLIQHGFNQFLIDMSFEVPSKTTLKRIVSKLNRSEAAQPSTTFNFKKGLR